MISIFIVNEGVREYTTVLQVCVCLLGTVEDNSVQ